MLQVERPVFVVAAPRSGSTMLFEALARNRAVWTLGGESHAEFENIEGWHPRDRQFESNRLTAADARPHDRDALCTAFAARLCDSDGVLWQSLPEPARTRRVRFLEKTPKNALRVPLLKALFPDARFVFLVREPRASVSSIIEAWRSGRFVTYRELPDWPGLPWSLLLPPGWREFRGAPLERIAAFQWQTANEMALADLEALPSGDWCAVTYDEIVSDPPAALARVCAFIGVAYDAGRATSSLPPSRHTLTRPRPGKWRANEATIAPLVPRLEPVWRRLLLAADKVRERHARDLLN